MDLLFGYLFVAKEDTDDVDSGVGFVGVAPDGRDVVEAEASASERMDAVAPHSTEAFPHEAAHHLEGD